MNRTGKRQPRNFAEGTVIEWTGPSGPERGKVCDRAGTKVVYTDKYRAIPLSEIKGKIKIIKK